MFNAFHWNPAFSPLPGHDAGSCLSTPLCVLVRSPGCIDGNCSSATRGRRRLHSAGPSARGTIGRQPPGGAVWSLSMGNGDCAVRTEPGECARRPADTRHDLSSWPGGSAGASRARHGRRASHRRHVPCASSYQLPPGSSAERGDLRLRLGSPCRGWNRCPHGRHRLMAPPCCESSFMGAAPRLPCRLGRGGRHGFGPSGSNTSDSWPGADRLGPRPARACQSPLA